MDGHAPVELVVGGDGTLGAALAAHLQAAGHPVVATTRREGLVGPRRPFLDLNAPVDSWSLPPGVGRAWLLAGISGHQWCRDHQRAAWRVNVAGTVALGRQLLARGIAVVLVSSNMVFSGDRPDRGEDAPTDPATPYGRMKAEAEAALLPLGATVVRLTKVVPPEFPRFRGWLTALGRGEPVHPLEELTFAPISLDYTLLGLVAAAACGAGGIFHLSGGEPVCYARVARLLAAGVGADPALVQPWTAEEAGVPRVLRPRHTALAMPRSGALLGLRPQPLSAALAGWPGVGVRPAAGAG